MSKMELQLKGAGLDPTTVGSVQAPVSLSVTADSFTIGEIKGDANLQSTLTNGQLSLSFNLVFDPKLSGCGLGNVGRADQDGAVRDLVALGLTEPQAKDVVKFVSGKLAKSVTGLKLVKPQPVPGEGKSAPKARARGIGLPDIPINIDPAIDIKNVAINNISLSSSTTISSNSVDLSGLTINDFSVVTDQPTFASIGKAEVDDFQMPPKQVPSLTLNDIGTTIAIPKIGSAAIPLSVNSNSGYADLTVLDWVWQPRWTWGFSVDLWICTLSFSLTFGFDFGIVVTYKWVLKSLKVSLSILNAFLNNIKVAINITSITLTNLSIGLLKFAQLLYSPATALKSLKRGRASHKAVRRKRQTK